MTQVALNTQAQPAQPPISVDMIEVERKVGKAKALLILDHPFWGTAVSRRPIKYDEAVGTACMAGTGQMTIAPSFIMALTVKQVMFLLAHEAMHYLGMHAFRRGWRKPGAFNIACDKVINDILIDAGVGEFIEGGVTMRDARNYAPEELYDDSDEDGPGGIGSDIGNPSDGNGNPLDDSQIHQIEAQAKIEMIQCAKAAKAVGKLPGSIERMVEEMIEVKTPWYEILERFLTSKIKDGISWTRPNRRFIHQGIYLPGDDMKPKMGTVVIGVDTSGSIQQSELNCFAGHANRILETCHPEKVVIVYCDAQVAHVDEYTLDDFPIQFKPHGGGGTLFEPVFDYIDENDIEPEVVVYLTDGYGPSNFTTHHETIWLTTASENFDFGEVIKFDMED